MALMNYGVLKGVPTHYLKNKNTDNDYHIRIDTMDDAFRIAVNRGSKQVSDDLYCHIIPDFKHPVLDIIRKQHFGFSFLKSRRGSGALDYLRDNLFDINDATLNRTEDLTYQERLEGYIQKAIDEKGVIYAFGECKISSVSPDKDRFFNHTPDQVLNKIGMNQGNSILGADAADNGIWQDGGILIYFHQSRSWTAIFLHFQSQALHTCNRTGIPVQAAATQLSPSVMKDEKPIRIVAAFVNPSGPERGKEKVLLFNRSDKAIDLTNCVLTNNDERKLPLDIQIKPGATTEIVMPGYFSLNNKGGVINLLDPTGKKLDGVQYSGKDVKKDDYWVVF